MVKTGDLAGKIHYLKQKQTAGKATERPLCNAGECSLQRYIFESIISADGPARANAQTCKRSCHPDSRDTNEPNPIFK